MRISESERNGVFQDSLSFDCTEFRGIPPLFQQVMVHTEIVTQKESLKQVLLSFFLQVITLAPPLFIIYFALIMC